MNNIYARGFFVVFSFLGLWFLMAQFNWEKLFKVKENTQSIEKKLGELTIDLFVKEHTKVEDSYIVRSVDSLVTKIAEANYISKKGLKVYVLKNSEVNAFALPDRQLVINTGLIESVDKQEMLSGVIAHELAHIEKKHVIKKLTREIGLSVLVSVISGQSDPGVISQIAKTLSSSAFDRKMEKEADMVGVQYLLNAKINPEPLADFFFFLEESAMPSVTQWISTHPISTDRSEYILKYLEEQDEIIFEDAISAQTWKTLKEKVYNIDEEPIEE
ncbi:M48 family metallopeptidase [Capnocytophaga canimorsus]|uniref:M48 family metallopeptidase n=1 Tax=Capnocytophaga canimorsus TaxID=28188 RepID=UPI0037D20436